MVFLVFEFYELLSVELFHWKCVGFFGLRAVVLNSLGPVAVEVRVVKALLEILLQIFLLNFVYFLFAIIL